MISYYAQACAATSAAWENNSSGLCPFLSALGLLSEIEKSKEGVHCFVFQSVALVRVDMEEGVKQLDKMALMCLNNLLSLIKAHTHAPQRQTAQTQFSTASAEWLFFALLLASEQKIMIRFALNVYACFFFQLLFLLLYCLIF